MDINTQYQHQPYLVLRGWIKYCNWYWLSENPNAVGLLENNPNKIRWDRLSLNTNASHLIHAKLQNDYHKVGMFSINWEYLSSNNDAGIISILEKNPNHIWRLFTPYHPKINWKGLSFNSKAIHLLEANLSKVNWFWLSANPGAIHLLEANPDKIDWRGLSTNPKAIHLLEDNPDKIDWFWLSTNPKAIHLLEANPDKIDWNQLSANPNAIHLLEANLDKIDWLKLCLNPNAIHLFETKVCSNPFMPFDSLDQINRLCWPYLSKNPSIFTYNYKKISKERAQIHEELYEYLHQPRFIQHWIESGNDVETYLSI